MLAGCVKDDVQVPTQHLSASESPGAGSREGLQNQNKEIKCRSVMSVLSQVGGQDLVETIAAILMSVCEIRRFSESRWLAIGTSCRVLISGLAIGLNDLVQLIQRDILFRILSLIPLHPLLSQLRATVCAPGAPHGGGL